MSLNKQLEKEDNFGINTNFISYYYTVNNDKTFKIDRLVLNISIFDSNVPKHKTGLSASIDKRPHL